MKSLYQISQNVLKANITGLIDLGTTPVRFVEFLLPSIPTSQLKILEENSPQLRTETNQIWKLACIRDFISIRILVEDNKLVKEPKSWRKVYLEEEIKQEEKMERLLGKMRTSYDKLADRAHSLHFDGVRAEKKRKLNVRRNSGGTSYPASKPTTLFSQVKSNAKKISSLYRAPSSQPKSYASAFPSGSSALRSNISTSFSNASITSRTTASSSAPIYREPEKKKEPARATAFSKNGGGFITPRGSSSTSTSNSFPGKPHSLVTSNSTSSSAVKVMTRTVNVIVPIGTTSPGNKIYTSSSMNNRSSSSTSSTNSNLGKRSR